MTKSELIKYLWSLDAVQLAQITRSAKYSVIDNAVNKAILQASQISEAELSQIQTEDQVAEFVRQASVIKP